MLEILKPVFEKIGELGSSLPDKLAPTLSLSRNETVGVIIILLIFFWWISRR